MQTTKFRPSTRIWVKARNVTKMGQHDQRQFTIFLNHGGLFMYVTKRLNRYDLYKRDHEELLLQTMKNI